jgi:hypothetical protein
MGQPMLQQLNLVLHQGDDCIFVIQMIPKHHDFLFQLIQFPLGILELAETLLKASHGCAVFRKIFFGTSKLRYAFHPCHPEGIDVLEEIKLQQYAKLSDKVSV